MTWAVLFQWTGFLVWAAIAALIVHFVVVAPVRAFIQALSRLFFEIYCLRRAGRKLREHALRRAITCVLQWTRDSLCEGPAVIESGPHTWDGNIWYGKWRISKKALDMP